MNPTNDPHGDALREHLRTWGGDAQQGAPAFHHVWHRAQQASAQRETTLRSPPMSWALAAAAAVVCTAAVMWMLQPSLQVPVAAESAIAANEAPATASTFDPSAPTDFLLSTTHGSDTPSVQQVAHEINALLTP
jgi:hypothetical protein